MQKRHMGLSGLGMAAAGLLLVSLFGGGAEAKPRRDKGGKEGTMPTVEKITLGAGCFWCTEAAYRLIDGVQDVKVGYMGGEVLNPTYKQVCSGSTGHAEVALVTFDASLVDLETVLKVFWKVHDPTSLNKQGGDVGSQYRSAIFYHADSQKAVIRASRKKAQREFTRPIVTEVSPATKFYEAENYHQDYYRNNPNAGYCRAVIAPKVKKVEKLKKEF